MIRCTECNLKEFNIFCGGDPDCAFGRIAGGNYMPQKVVTKSLVFIPPPERDHNFTK